MAVITQKTVRKPRSAGNAGMPRRRVIRTVEMHEEPSGELEHKEMPMKPRLARRALKPLKEAYFVGIGALDWMIEKAMIIERELSERGHRRNETLSRMAAQMGTATGEKTREMSTRGRTRMQRMREKVGEKMEDVAIRQEMPESEPA